MVADGAADQPTGPLQQNRRAHGQYVYWASQAHPEYFRNADEGIGSDWNPSQVHPRLLNMSAVRPKRRLVNFNCFLNDFGRVLFQLLASLSQQEPSLMPLLHIFPKETDTSLAGSCWCEPARTQQEPPGVYWQAANDSGSCWWELKEKKYSFFF